MQVELECRDLVFLHMRFWKDGAVSAGGQSSTSLQQAWGCHLGCLKGPGGSLPTPWKCRHGGFELLEASMCSMEMLLIPLQHGEGEESRGDTWVWVKAKPSGLVTISRKMSISFRMEARPSSCSWSETI